MKILVTGNTGLLGRAVFSELAKSGEFTPIPFKTKYQQKEVNNKNDCEDALKGVDGVIHLASNQPYKNEEQKDYFNVNSEGSYLLRKIAAKKGILPFIYSSSQDIYDLNSMPENGFNENSDLAPVSTYAKSKLAAEIKLRELNSQGLLIFRLSVLIGDSVHPQSFFDYLLEQTKKEKKIELFGRGKRIYDFIKTIDVAKIFLIGLRNSLEGTYNLGAGKRIRVSDIAELMGTLTGSRIIYLLDKLEKPDCFLDCRKLFNLIDFNLTPMEISLKKLLISERIIK